MSLGKILTVKSGPTLPAEMTTTGRRSRIDRGLATHKPERIARNSRGHKHRSATAPPTRIAVAIDNVEDAIDFISNQPAKTSAHEWTVNHVCDSTNQGFLDMLESKA